MWIDYVDEDSASGLLEEVYAKARDRYGRVAALSKLMSLRPEVAQARGDMARLVSFGGSSLGRRREELIALVVARLLRATYSSVAHARFLEEDGGFTRDEVVQIALDWRSSDQLSIDERAMLAWIELFTISCHELTEDNVEELRSVGFSDLNILDIALAAGYRNWFARFGPAFGVLPEVDRDFDPRLLEF